MSAADQRTDVAALREALDAVDIDGPWSAATTGVRGGDHWYVCNSGESVAQIAANDGIDEEQREPRARLIVAAVNALPVLLDELDAARATLRRVEALIETDGVFLKKDTKIKRVQEDRRHDLGAIVTTSMVTVADLRATLAPVDDTTEAS